jgi:hemoglobin
MGADNIHKMISDFYAELEKSDIRSMFPENMEEAAKKSASFFIFLLGGPPLYQQMYGSPMMRQRHLPFVIDEKARLVWLNCFKDILKDAPSKYNFPAEHLAEFTLFLDKFSGWMVNSKS